MTADGAATVPDGVEPATLKIGDDGAVTMFTGCNNGGASVTQDGETLVFKGAVITRMACEGGGTELENIVLAVLDGETSAVIDDETLVVTKGDQSLVFHAS
jgi:heat shock protein HslJ